MLLLLRDFQSQCSHLFPVQMQTQVPSRLLRPLLLPLCLFRLFLKSSLEILNNRFWIIYKWAIITATRKTIRRRCKIPSNKIYEYVCVWMHVCKWVQMLLWVTECYLTAKHITIMHNTTIKQYPPIESTHSKLDSPGANCKKRLLFISMWVSSLKEILLIHYYYFIIFHECSIVVLDILQICAIFIFYGRKTGAGWEIHRMLFICFKHRDFDTFFLHFL